MGVRSCAVKGDIPRSFTVAEPKHVLCWVFPAPSLASPGAPLGFFAPRGDCRVGRCCCGVLTGKESSWQNNNTGQSIAASARSAWLVVGCWSLSVDSDNARTFGENWIKCTCREATERMDIRPLDLTPEYLLETRLLMEHPRLSPPVALIWTRRGAPNPLE